MIFTHPRCLQCFPTQENSNQRPSTLKLSPLISQVFLSWTFFSLPLQNELKHLNSAQWQTKSRHASEKSHHGCRVRPKVRQPYPEIASRLHKLRHDFAFSRNHPFCQQNRATPLKIAPPFWVFTTSQLEAIFNNLIPAESLRESH